jgi:CheY-like chemotaxis protein
MTQPLALVLYEKLLPGSQLVNRLQDLQYRVQVLGETQKLVESAEQCKPMVVVVDLGSNGEEACSAITRLKQNQATEHLPVIAIAAEGFDGQKAQNCGATLVVSDSAILNHLPELLEQALQVE